jgi:hypothetical protein
MSSDKIAQPLVISGEVESPQRTVQRKFEIKAILIPILLLLVTLSPGIGSGVGITASKAITGGLVLLLTLPGVAASLLNMNRTKGRLILLGFLTMSVLNIFVAMANHLLLSYWLRLAFGSYVFGAMALTTSYYANTPNRRHNLWVWLVIFLTLASFSQWFFTASSTIGLEESLESRSIGAKAGPLVATMILLPAVGKFLLKSLWLVLGFYSNVFLLILSISRTNYILLGVGILYSLVFIHRKFIRAILFLCFVLGLGLILLNTPVYDLVAQRFSHVGKDESSLARIDQAKSAIAIGLGGNFQTLLFGKGFGSPYKVQYKLTRAGGYPHHDTLEFMPPHNDYAARILYCGLTGGNITFCNIRIYIFYCHKKVYPGQY